MKMFKYFIFFLLISFSAKATMMLSLNLDQLTRIATHIIKGKVLDVKEVQEGNRTVAYVTITVEERIKGAGTKETFIFNQPVSSPGQNFKNTFHFPEYKIGKTYVFFLPENGGPIGMKQGVFEVDGDNLVNFKSRKKHLFRRLEKPKNQNTETLLNQNRNPDSDQHSVKNFMRLIDALKTSPNNS